MSSPRQGMAAKTLSFSKWMKKSFFLYGKVKKNSAKSLENYQMKMNILRKLSCTYFISITVPWPVGYIKMTDSRPC